MLFMCILHFFVSIRRLEQNENFIRFNAFAVAALAALRLRSARMSEGRNQFELTSVGSSEIGRAKSPARRAYRRLSESAVN